MQTFSVDDLEVQAMALTEEQRAELADRLAESLVRGQATVAQQAWYDLARKRRDDVREGRVQGVPSEEVFARVRQLVGR